MILFKNSALTMEGVLKHQKHATDVRVDIKHNDIILIQQTMDTLKSNQKSIRWVMEFDRMYLDEENESDRIWGRHWNYIIKGKNLRPIEEFDISELQVSKHHYGNAQRFAYIDSADEKVILDWISHDLNSDNDNIDLEVEFSDNGVRDIHEIIQILNNQYAGKPEYKTVITKSLNRPTALRNAIIERDGSKCKICGKYGFRKKNGGEYCEVHHMIELNKHAPNTLQSWNILVLCPTCHKQLHYGDVKNEFLNPGWKLIIDGKEKIIK